MLFMGIARGLLSVLLIVAAIWDIRRRRVPNVLSGPILLTGIVVAAIDEGVRGAFSALLASVLVIVLVWFPWLKGRLGGGDVKLMAAAASWVGMSFLVEYLLATALAGGVVSLVCYFLSSASARRDMHTNLSLAVAGVVPEPPLRGENGRVSVPYSVAAAAAALVVVLLRRGW